jgi:putative transposase
MGFHVLNRGHRRETVFPQPADFDTFVKAMADATARWPLDLLGSGLMPHHFHRVIRAQADGDLGRWVRGLLGAHAPRDHRHDHTTGQVWPGRYQAFPVPDDDHLVGVLRSVERPALRAERVVRAEDWKGSSMPGWFSGDPLLWRVEGPVRDQRWWEQVNEPLSAGTGDGCSCRRSGAGPMGTSRGRKRRRHAGGWSRRSGREGDPESRRSRAVRHRVWLKSMSHSGAGPGPKSTWTASSVKVWRCG